jgi:flagellar basal body-associated protein FliL
MKKEYDRPSGKPLIVYRSIMVILLAIVAVLITGSLYALIRPSNSEPLFRLGGQDGGKEKQNAATDDAISVFSGIGRLRIPLAVQPAATVILSISFPYPAADRLFAEELASHIGEFRSIATAYFSSLSGEKAVNPDEEAAKTEILRRYNAILRLGRIETLYFGDLMIVN